MPSNHIKMDPSNSNSGLKVDLWNVNGLSEENSKEDFFVKQIHLFDIDFVPETWQREDCADKMIHSHGFFYQNIYRKIKTENKRIWGDFSLL